MIGRVAAATANAAGPLAGIKVVELGQLIAGPFCGALLSQFGAQVIKVESLNGGDPLRVWRELDKDGTSPWWRSLGRNKKSVTIDLRKERGQDLVKNLINDADVLIENFKPGTTEKWGLGPDHFSSNPGLVYTRVSGYGQTGPYSTRPGYASVCEAMGMFRHVNGEPGQAPIRPNISLGDSLAGLQAAFGTMLALRSRDQTGKGQVVDVAIYEAVANMMEGVIPEFDRLGTVRQPSGTTVSGIVPTNVHKCSDGVYVVIGGNGDSIYKRLMNAIGQPDLTGPEYERNSHRVTHQDQIYKAIDAFTIKYTSDQVMQKLQDVGVPVGKIYDVEQYVNDPHVQSRGMIQEITVNPRNSNESWTVKVPGISPVLSDTPGKTQHAGPELGADNEYVFKDILKLSDADIQSLQSDNVIGPL